MLRRADDLARMTVIDDKGGTVELGTLWRTRPAVLVFVRHFGCIHCRAQIVALQREIGPSAAGASVSVIGNGSPSFIDGFREQTGWGGAIYTDPSLAVYGVAQLKRGVASTLDPRSLGAALRAFTKGTRQGRTQGDQWQQGGVLLIAPTGDVIWQHTSDRPGDNATAAQILAALG